jgi:hypothetical protein
MGDKDAIRNLKRRVEVAMAALQKNPPKQTKRPAYPNYHNGSARPETSGGGRK